jgi:ribosome maturation factor RimP
VQFPRSFAVEFVFTMKSSYQIQIEAKLSALVEPAVLEAGVELVELQWVQRKSSSLVRLLVDKLGGISLDDCAEISRRVSFLLETADPIEGRYTLEVSSPGLDRLLTTEADFRRKIGETIRLTLANGDRTSEVTGELVKVEDERLTLMTATGEDGFPLKNVVRGKIIF